MFIALFLVTKRADMTYEAFKKHQLDVHIPLVRQLPGLRDYSVSFLPPNGDQAQPHDLCASLYFDSADAFGRAMESPEAQIAVADQPNMLDVSKTVVLTGETASYSPTPAA